MATSKRQQQQNPNETLDQFCESNQIPFFLLKEPEFFRHMGGLLAHKRYKNMIVRAAINRTRMTCVETYLNYAQDAWRSCAVAQSFWKSVSLSV